MLVAMLQDDFVPPVSGCASWFEAALGPVDGHATERVAERLRTVAAAWSPTDERLSLERRRRWSAVGLLARSVAAEGLWTAATPVAKVAGEERRVTMRRRHAAELRVIAARALRSRSQPQND
jgi:hypothetical protein